MTDFEKQSPAVVTHKQTHLLSYKDKQTHDSVTNPAFSYINSLSATNSIGGRANARFILERFTRYFLGHSWLKVDWHALINDPELTVKAVAGYLQHRSQQKAYFTDSEVIEDHPFFALHISPLLAAIRTVGEHLSLNEQVSENAYKKWELIVFNTDFSKKNYLQYGAFLPIEEQLTLNIERKLKENESKALESFCCFLITSCISRFNWDKFLIAPVVKAMMTDYFDQGVRKNGIKIRNYSPGTVENTYRMICGVAEHHWLAENMTVERLQRIKAIKLAKGSRQSSGRYITFRDFDNMLSIIENYPNSIRIYRDKSLISLMFYTGLRRHEIVNLRMNDIDWNDCLIQVIGKGNKERAVPFSEDSEAAVYLQKWINLRAVTSHLDGNNPYIFTRVSKSKCTTNHKLTTQAINDVCKWIVNNGLGRIISPHDFRHTVATNLLAQGHDLLTVSAVLGHASPATTQRYDKRGKETLKQTVINRV